jgi:hypothetical protein
LRSSNADTSTPSLGAKSFDSRRRTETEAESAYAASRPPALSTARERDLRVVAGELTLLTGGDERLWLAEDGDR